MKLGISDLLRLRSIARSLDGAPRMGADQDSPEGLRYIQLSDTLAKEIAKTLYGASKESEALLPEGVGLEMSKNG